MKINAFPSRSLFLSLSRTVYRIIDIWKHSAYFSGSWSWSQSRRLVWPKPDSVEPPAACPIRRLVAWPDLCPDLLQSLPPSLSISLSLFRCALESYAFHTKLSSQSNDSRHFIRGGWSMARSLESLVCVCLALGEFALVVSHCFDLKIRWISNRILTVATRLHLKFRGIVGPIKLIELFSLTAD